MYATRRLFSSKPTGKYIETLVVFLKRPLLCECISSSARVNDCLLSARDVPFDFSLFAFSSQAAQLCSIVTFRNSFTTPFLRILLQASAIWALS